MLIISKMIYHIIILLILQNTNSFGAPLPVIYQAQPQIMMHTLQQPIPIETLASLKRQTINQQIKRPIPIQSTLIIPNLPQTPSEVLQELAKIQAMQHSIPMKTQAPLLTSILLNQMTSDNLQPTNSYLNQEIPIQMNQDHESVQINQGIMDYQNQGAQDAMQEIALEQQMLALQQMQALKQMNTVHSPIGLYQPEPILILLPDEEENTANDLTKHNHNFEDHHQDEIIENEELDSITIGAAAEDIQEENVNKANIHKDNPNNQKGMRKAILLIPNARFSIGGIISQIPWLPIEVNVPDTAIWAWNGISSGISSIISGIGGWWSFGSRPQESMPPEQNTSVKMFLNKLQTNTYPVLPVYSVPMENVRISNK